MTEYLGKQIGNYRIIKKLGRGGFGEVYLGEHLYLKTQAAIKILQTQLPDNERAAFLREAQTIAALKHPNIIQIHDFGLQDDTPFLVMDYAPNGTMRQRYPSGTRVPLQDVVVYAKQIAAALQYAHEQRVVHRDIKPENILIGQKGEILLSDFGLAVFASLSSPQSGQNIGGTPAYMSPEQIQGHASPASDQYALAIVIFEWLTGRRPFIGNLVEVSSQQLHASPPSLRSLAPDLPPVVEQALFPALNKDPQQRFLNISALASALAQCQTDVNNASGPVAYTSSPNIQSSAPGFYAQGIVPPPASVPTPVLTPGSFPSFQTTSQNLNTPAPVGDARPLMTQAPPPVAMRSGTHKGLLAIISILLVLLVGVSALGGGYILTHQSNNNPAANSVTGVTSQPTGSINTPTVQSTTPVELSPSAAVSTPSPTSPPVLAPGTVIYQADWSKGLDGWNGAFEWKSIGDGTLGSDGTSTGDDGFIIWAPAKVAASNYVIEAQLQYIRHVNSDSPDEFGIIFRGDGTNNGYEIGVQNENGYSIHRNFTQNAMTLIAKVTNDDASSYYNISDDKQTLNYQAYQPDTENHTFRVEVFGNTIKFYIDGLLVNTTSDNTYLSGRVGLRSVRNNINVRSFKVTACSVTGC